MPVLPCLTCQVVRCRLKHFAILGRAAIGELLSGFACGGILSRQASHGVLDIWKPRCGIHGSGALQDATRSWRCLPRVESGAGKVQNGPKQDLVSVAVLWTDPESIREPEKRTKYR